jgi:hypothetical protein
VASTFELKAWRRERLGEIKQTEQYRGLNQQLRRLVDYMVRRHDNPEGGMFPRQGKGTSGKHKTPGLAEYFGVSRKTIGAWLAEVVQAGVFEPAEPRYRGRGTKGGRTSNRYRLNPALLSPPTTVWTADVTQPNHEAVTQPVPEPVLQPVTAEAVRQVEVPSEHLEVPSEHLEARTGQVEAPDGAERDRAATQLRMVAGASHRQGSEAGLAAGCAGAPPADLASMSAAPRQSSAADPTRPSTAAHGIDESPGAGSPTAPGWPFTEEFLEEYWRKAEAGRTRTTPSLPPDGVPF